MPFLAVLLPKPSVKVMQTVMGSMTTSAPSLLARRDNAYRSYAKEFLAEILRMVVT